MTNDKETLRRTSIQAYCVSKNEDGTPCGWRGEARMTLDEATGDGGRHMEETTVTDLDGIVRHHAFLIKHLPAP